MKLVRTHQSLIAWMLYGFMLFSGLVCSLSHGQMLGAFNQLHPAVDCSADREMDGRPDLAQMAEHARLMKLSMADCAFAGVITLVLMLFIGLRWIARSRPKAVARSDYLLRKPPRYRFPELSPQAP